MADKVAGVLQDFKKFARQGKLYIDPDLFEDLGWTLACDPPDFWDNMELKMHVPKNVQKIP